MEVTRALSLACLGALLAACPRPSSAPEGCGKDTDCKGSRVCVNNQCAEPLPGSRPLPDPSDAMPVSAAPGVEPYAMFGGDERNSGVVRGPAPNKKPREVWRFTTGAPIVGSPTVGPDGTVYVTSHDKHLYAVTAKGKLKWKLATDDRVWSTPAVAENGAVYTGSDDDHIYAVDGATGKVKWKYRLGACDPPIGFGPEGARCDGDGGPTIGLDGTIYTGGDGVYALWPDGTLRWKLATPAHVSTAPALGPDGRVYAGCQDDALYAIRPDGTKAWEYRTRGDIESSPALGPDGTIYFGSDDGGIYALTADGALKWRVITKGDVRGSPALGADGTVFVGSHEGRLYAISPAGKVLWRFAAADRLHGSPVVASNGVILIGSQDDHLYAVSPDGALLWFLELDDDVDSAPTIAEDGTLYVASDDGTLRAYR